MFLIDKILGTGFFSGYFPYFPGTIGSGVAFVMLFWLDLGYQDHFVLIVLGLALGVKVSQRLERVWGDDPSIIVIDEFVGIWIASIGHNIFDFWTAALIFVLFRIFDIWKPLGIYKIQSLPDGWGVMMDDVLAGVYANLLVWAYVLIK